MGEQANIAPLLELPIHVDLRPQTRERNEYL